MLYTEKFFLLKKHFLGKIVEIASKILWKISLDSIGKVSINVKTVPTSPRLNIIVFTR